MGKKKEKKKDVLADLSQIISSDTASSEIRESIREFINLVTVYNFLVLKMLFNLKKTISETDKGKIKDILKTVFNMSDERSSKIIRTAEKVPEFLKDEDLLGCVIDLSRILSLEDGNIEYNKAIKYSFDRDDRLIKELQNKDKVIAKLLLLYAKKQDKKGETNGK